MRDRDTKRDLEEFAARRDEDARQLQTWATEHASKWAQEENAAKYNAQQRRDAAKRGDALPDGSFPIMDQEDMNNAATLAGNSSHPKATVHAHMKKQAKKKGLKLPDSVS
jgi:hypothetical protein